ncbi:NAD(+) synthase [Marinilabiliaceae bacterium JC017]|nr:NAD(+) synthase [Marinilabiliaceae bacterium JC017]
MELNKYEKAVANIRRELESYISGHNLKSLVIGESGGIDSALCSALAAPVCAKLGVKLIGRSITIETNKQDEIDRGKAIGEAFCTDFKEIDLTSLYKVTLEDVEEAEPADESDREKRVRLGNIKARMRMVYLYNLAQKFRGIVLSTDNYTEFLLGFWTLHGDVGDYGMIQQLWKTEVYELSQYLVDNELQGDGKAALQSCIDAVPTDGLGITSSDLEQLGASSYFEVDETLKKNEGNPDNFKSKNPVIQRHVRSEYKRNHPFNLTRDEVFAN